MGFGLFAVALVGSTGVVTTAQRVIETPLSPPFLASEPILCRHEAIGFSDRAWFPF